MLKKQIILYLLLILWAIGETEKDYLKLAITSSQNGYYELSNKYLEEYIASKKEDFLDLVYLIYGYNLLNLEKYPDAIKKFEIIIERFPLSPYIKNSYQFIITSYLKINDISSSLNYYREYKKKFGKEEEIEKQIGKILLEKGISFFKNKSFTEAKNEFEIIINEFETTEIVPWANYYLGLIEFENSNFKKALQYFKKVIDTGKGEIVVDSKLKTGDCYFNQGEYENAEDYYRQVLKEDIPIFCEWAKFQIAIIEKRRGNIEKAKEILSGIKYKNDNELEFNVLNELASLYILSEDWKNAENTLNQIINQFSERKEISEIYFKLGIVNFNKRDFDKSLSFFQKALKIAKENSVKEKTLFFIGYTYYIKGNFNESFKYWENLQKEYPESSFIPQILFLKGRKLYEDNKLNQAEIIFKEIIEKGLSYYEDAYPYLMEILIKNKKFEEAEIYAKKFLEKKKDVRIEFFLGKTFYLKGEKDKAEEIFRNIKIENPVIKAELTFYLGDIYRKKGNIEKAREKFIEVISLYPQYKEWKELAEKSLKELGK